MSTKGSGSRVRNKRKFDKNFDNIDFSKKKKEASEVVEGIHTEDGKATRYYYGSKKTKNNDSPSVVSRTKSGADTFLENHKGF